jgi:tyrosyl-tRNA synthetase
MNVVTDKAKIDAIFNRGVIVEVLPSKEGLLQLFYSGKRLKIYIGVDPTSTSLHLSHAKNYMLLEEFRQLGHEVIVLFGDFTASIGDPSGRENARPQLTEKQIKENVKSWLSQIQPLMDFKDKKNPPRVLYNGKWLSKLSFKEIVQIAANFTVQQMIERDMFEKRLEEDVPIHLHEFLYPLMQGYDSVAMEVDIELCGTDQIFNALAGRKLLKRMKNKEKSVVAVNLMENPKTHELMSKSKGTGVFLSSSPNEMYGSIMAQPDEMTELLFVNCTRIPLSEKASIFALGPKAAKETVALEIVKKFYGEKSALAAKENFAALFSRKEAPKNLPELQLSAEAMTLISIVSASGVLKSRSEARRLVEQGGLEIDGEVRKNPMTLETLHDGQVVKIGKRQFFRVKIK